MTGPIRCTPLPHPSEGHAVISFDRPGRVEVVGLAGGGFILHVYEGTDASVFDEPIGAYDTTIQNQEWTR